MQKDQNSYNMSEEYILSRRFIRDFILAHDLTPTTVPITDDLLKSFKANRLRYEAHLENEQKIKKNLELEKKKKEIEDEIINTEKKDQCLQGIC